MRKRCHTCLGNAIVDNDGPKLCGTCYGGRFLWKGKPMEREDINLGPSEGIVWPQCHVEWAA